ncbi:cyclopropane-fatty-acyl-phospholipid synthase family protein [Palleronia sp. LCG004]|uniref:cyclopropane-fatty-acyl-phospholipid synthase family protein n=1 Tax=Palleronia sp. LCG004 TaxID=3079304 RepID=UPI002942EEEC|nr:cyclopropane-fatty-acyl-phospholipid synthase family protein [Palleronia sp. LCG004]WOI57428.1 cyclopropane-fatty-acyl-phospholipid synthase family protein [Palleronia sp. LCG004]
MWDRMFERIVRDVFRDGTLDVTLPSGRRFTAGSGSPKMTVRITDPTLPRRIVANPDLGLGEGYMDGGIEIEGDDLRGFLDMMFHNLGTGNRTWILDLHNRMGRRLRRMSQWNPMSRARSNVAHHYDLSAELYDIFLDADRQYSCAYFRHEDDSLEQAQSDKKTHIAAKLLIEPGMEILDIGCGWGGMALTLARDFGAKVTGVTLSREQHAIAERRAREAGLEDRVEFLLSDYRAIDRTFDRIVSVGMFEHVGQPHYDEYFAKVHDMLRPDGVALIHTIGRTDAPGATSPFIAKYIFPGGYVPALSEMSAAFERQGLGSTDIEVWRMHYAKTLRHWEERFSAGIEKARALYDDRFCRMWRYYLVASELSFVHGHQVVFQAQLAHRKTAVPITRDYLYRN